MAHRIALRSLTAQARSRAELERTLRRRNVPEPAADRVLDRLTAVGLVDDAQLAREWVAVRQPRRQLSRDGLRRELQAKGVAREAIESALADLAPEAEREAAQTLARRRLRSMTGLAREVQYRRLAATLGRRGFSGGLIAAVLDDVLAAGAGPGGPDHA